MQGNFIIGFTLIHHAKLDFVHKDTILRIDVITFFVFIAEKNALRHQYIFTHFNTLIGPFRCSLAYIFRFTLFISISIFVSERD